MKIIFIIFILLVVGGGVFWFIFLKDEEGKVFVEENKITGEIEVFNLHPYFVEFKPLVIPVIKNGQLVSNIGVIVSLEVRNEKNQLYVKEKKIALRNAFLRDLRLATRNFDGTQALKLPEIKIRFQKSCDRLLGENIVDHVLVKNDMHKEL